ncbi:hypothetical protein BDW74DRAFT_174443 [Aspergillus multicolor]|uniref:uncharacterized protein n=1 Tax=Aspergillus multicolor TaxID=41759 RepID=UPI003CCDAB75
MEPPTSSASGRMKTDLEASDAQLPTIAPPVPQVSSFFSASKEKTGGQGNICATEEDLRKITGFRWFLICAALYLSALMYGLDTTIAADMQGPVTETFSEVSQLAWIGAGFPLGSVAVIVPYGFLYTTFSMKYLYIAGIVFFQAGSVLCGAAPTMNTLIERGTYLTGTGFVWGLGAILGPVVGVGFSDSSATWRWGFYINLIIGAVTAPVYLFYLPSIHPGAGESLRNRFVRLDYVGFVLSAGMGVAFAMGFISAGGMWAWGDGRTIALIVVFVMLLAAYALQQYLCIFTTAATRSFPGHLLRSRTQILLYITTTCANTGMFFTTYYIPIYFQFTQNDSSLMAAVRLLPYLLVTITCNLATGWALPKVQYYMPLCLISGTLMTLAAGLLVALLSTDTPTALTYGFSILMAVGTGITMRLGYAFASLKVPPADIFSAINLQNAAQIGATVICLVIAGQVFQSTAVHNLNEVLDGHGFSQAEIHGAVARAQSPLFQNLNGDLRDAAIRAITGAIQRAFIVPLVAGGVGLTSSLLMKGERLLE